MKRKQNALSVIWEPVNDADCRERLHQALKIIFSEDAPSFPTSFDEMTRIHQYEGEPAPGVARTKGGYANAN
jgi:hypothetical protein